MGIRRRHNHITVGTQDTLDQHTVVGISRNDRDSTVVGCFRVLFDIEPKIAFTDGFIRTVAGKAIGAQDRQHILTEANRIIGRKRANLCKTQQPGKKNLIAFHDIASAAPRSKIQSLSESTIGSRRASFTRHRPSQGSRTRYSQFFAAVALLSRSCLPGRIFAVRRTPERRRPAKAGIDMIKPRALKVAASRELLSGRKDLQQDLPKSATAPVMSHKTTSYMTDAPQRL